MDDISIEAAQAALQRTFGECSFQIWSPSRDWTAEEPRNTVPTVSVVAQDEDVPGAVLTAAERMSAIEADLGICERCILCRNRKNIVFGSGDPEADLVVIGEAPGAEEDVQGKPFVGASGKKLDAMLSNVLGLQRSSVYILNVVKCRPQRNRNPSESELESCLPFLHRQISVIDPKLILLMGTVALKALFGTPDGITRNRGQWRAYNGVPVMPTFHPAFLIYQESSRRRGNRDLQRNTRLVWKDLVTLRDRMDELGIDRHPITSRP